MAILELLLLALAGGVIAAGLLGADVPALAKVLLGLGGRPVGAWVMARAGTPPGGGITMAIVAGAVGAAVLLVALNAAVAVAARLR